MIAARRELRSACHKPMRRMAFGRPIDGPGGAAYNLPDGPAGPRATSAAFTLTEVLVAMGVLAIGAVAALSLFAAAAATHKRAVDRANSAYLAEHVIALMEVRLRGDADLADLEVQGGKVEEYPDYEYDVVLEDLEGDGGYGLEVLVVVTIRWNTKGRQGAEEYQTILLRSLGESDYLGGRE